VGSGQVVEVVDRAHRSGEEINHNKLIIKSCYQKFGGTTFLFFSNQKVIGQTQSNKLLSIPLLCAKITYA